MTRILDATFKVFDIETTGLDPNSDKVVEVAAVLARLDTGLLGAWSCLVNPGREIPATASAIHHLTDEDVAGAPPLETVLPILKSGGFDCIVAHNAVFDTGFIPFDEPVLCTRRLALKLWPELEGTSNQYLRYHLKLACPEVKGLAAHRAEADAIVTAHLLLRELEELMRRSKDPDLVTVEGLTNWVREPILLRICPFAKYKGVPWAQVPKDYLQWMVGPKGMKDMDFDTRHTVEHYLRA